MIALPTRRYLIEYVRRPVNLVLLVVVPVVFVVLTAGVIADFADVGGSDTGTAQLKSATAGWAAAFLAGIAGFFAVTGSRAADRRLAAAGTGTTNIVSARLAAGLVLAVLASLAAVLALALRSGIGDVPRVIGATILMAVTYLGIGAAIGALVRNEVNGSLIVIFVWMVDVFLGPAMSSGDAIVTRFFPTHFATLFMVGSASGYAGPFGDLGLAVIWAVGAVAVAGVFLVVTTRPKNGRIRSHTPGSLARIRTGLHYAFVDYGRNVVMWVLLAMLPVFFITLTFIITPGKPAAIEVTENGATSLESVSMIDLHGAIMVPITVAFLAGLAGLFVVLGSAEGDRRLVLAGYRTGEVLLARVGVIVAAVLLITGVSEVVAAIDFSPQSWLLFTVANVLVALTYAMIGVLVGPLFGRLGGVYLMFLLPFVDVGVAQNIMFSSSPPGWGRYLPAHGAVELLVDGAFTPSFDVSGGLITGLVWLAVMTVGAWLVFHRLAAPTRA